MQLVYSTILGGRYVVIMMKRFSGFFIILLLLLTEACVKKHEPTLSEKFFQFLGALSFLAIIAVVGLILLNFISQLISQLFDGSKDSEYSEFAESIAQLYGQKKVAFEANCE